jgi:uncharacterized membrane protein YphA (DoxX/SURF4 family)
MKTNGQLSTITFVAGRFIAGGVYLMAGIQNLLELDAKAGYTASKGVSNATFWVTVASLLLVLGGASIMTGIRPYLGVGAIALFLIPVTLIMHNFWALSGMQATIEFHAFMGNLGLLGSALLFVAIPQPWAVSLDKWVASFPRVRERVVGRQNSIADAKVSE